jgi:hypothetical protein
MISSFVLQAQPSLLHSDMAPFGSSFTLTFAQTTVVDTTIQGANVVWDFSSFQPTTGSITINIVNPALTPYATSFPNSNYAYQESPVTAYRYFDLSTTKMERVGSWTNSIGIRTYNDPQIEYVFPLTLGTYSFDTWDNSTSPTGGTYEFQCIGYGTVILPMGTFNDMLMVRALITESFLYYYSYFWYSTTSGIPYVNYLPQGPFTGEALVYATAISIPTNIDDNTNSLAFKYTNPVLDNLTIYSNSGISHGDYEIFNALGQKIDAGKLNSNSDFSTIDMSHLEKGLYFCTLRSSDQSGTTIKVLKL